ncbi:MAG TPA: helix-hairpin-helix domain-containing protein [Candidatus Dormibacteraeota bacterium]|nr:helix-hairpin-helix domain-containing protein [Candidatus Dormibacteraeota bacterium]
MASVRTSSILTLSGLAMLIPLVLGCNANQTDEAERERNQKTREEVAKATERAKPAIEEAGKKIGEAASKAADEARAAAEGVKEGWSRGGHQLLDINSASERELRNLPGITKQDALKIVDGRPYRDKHELVAKGILSDAAYMEIRDHITVAKRQ